MDWWGRVIPEMDGLWIYCWFGLVLNAFDFFFSFFVVRLFVLRLVRTITCIRWSVGLPG